MKLKIEGFYRIIRTSRICKSSVSQLRIIRFLLKLIYTQSREVMPQNLDFAYNCKDVSVPMYFIPLLRPFSPFPGTTKRRPMRRLFKFSGWVYRGREVGTPSAARFFQKKSVAARSHAGRCRNASFRDRENPS